MPKAELKLPSLMIYSLAFCLLGVIFLSEKLRTFQWLAVFTALLGVCYMTFVYGQFPAGLRFYYRSAAA